MTPAELAEHLANLGYPGFAHLRTDADAPRPAAVLLGALTADALEPRAAEALPWLVLRFADLDWEPLVQEAVREGVQNRLGFVVNLARRYGMAHGLAPSAALAACEALLERCRTRREGTMARPAMTTAERDYLRMHRSLEVAHWHLLTDLAPDQLHHME